MVKCNVFRLYFTLKKKKAFVIGFLSPWFKESSFPSGLIKAGSNSKVELFVCVCVFFFFFTLYTISYLKAEPQHLAISKTEMNYENFILY